MSIFEGLSFFEIVLLVMGVFLFLVLVFLLIWNAIKQKPYKALLAFFILPIAMIGYSSIKSIDYKGFTITLQNATDSVQANPTNTTARTNLMTILGQIGKDSKMFSSPSALVNIARAHFSLGNYDSSSNYLGIAESLDPATPQLATVRQQVNQQVTEEQELNKQAMILNTQLARLETAPKDEKAVDTITKTLATLKRPTYASPTSVLTVAKALAVVDQGQRSIEKVDKVIQAAPASPEALQLKKQIQDSAFVGRVKVTPQQKQLLLNTKATPLVSRNTLNVRLH